MDGHTVRTKRSKFLLEITGLRYRRAIATWYHCRQTRLKAWISGWLDGWSGMLERTLKRSSSGRYKGLLGVNAMTLKKILKLVWLARRRVRLLFFICERSKIQYRVVAGLCL